MRLSLLHLLLAAGLSSLTYARPALAQEILNRKVTLQAENQRLRTVLNKLEKAGRVSFMYQPKLLGDNPRVTLSATDRQLGEVLNELLIPYRINYRVIGRQIVLRPVEVRPEASENTEGSAAVAPPVVDRTIMGNVLDEADEPLAGATVSIKGTTRGTTTNASGRFSLVIEDSDAVLVVSFIGFETKEIQIGSQSSFGIVLNTNDNVMDEVVVVGYGSTKKINLTGSVATVDSKTIETAAPVASTTNLLAGRLPGLISRQNSGSPGRDAANLSIRGFGDALVIVDGVETPINNLDPNEIASVSILKDASAAVYGSRAGNGVILVTTKRGRAGKPTITLNSTYTQQRITNFSSLLNAGEYAEWDRQSDLNRDRPESQINFSAEQVRKYYEGTDPDFPSTNWYDVVVKPYAPQQQHNVSIRGGSEKVKYYGLIGYLDQNTFWRSNGGNFKRFNIRSNVDANISDNLVMKIGFSNINEDRKFPAREAGGNDAALWQDLQFSRPTVAAFFPDRTKLPDAGQPVGGSILASSDYEQVGYRLQENQLTQINAALEYDFPFLPGLSARVMSNYAQANNFDKTFERPIPYYDYNATADTYTLKGVWKPQASVFEVRGRDRVITNNLSLNFDRTFAQHHQFSALLLHESVSYSSDYSRASRRDFLTPSIEYIFGGSQDNQYADGSASEMGRKGYVGRLNYIFKNKYLFEATIRADASAKFPTDSRWGYFPSVSAGWVLSEEDF